MWESTRMEVVYVTHPLFAEHDAGPIHPERPARLRAVEAGVMESGLGVLRTEAKAGALEDLHLIHRPDYVEAIRRFCATGGGHLDPDTRAGPRSYEAALFAVGAGLTAVDQLRGSDRPATAFVSVRPPGHHALPDRAMGFCLFNNVAVSAERLRLGGSRVAIVDWDVHHGNGTQQVFSSVPEVLYVSIHQSPFYPFEGSPEDVGEGAAQGTLINLGVPAGTAGDLYEEFWQRLVLPVLIQFAPDWILVSAGYDAHADDPLAELRLESSDYGLLAAGLTKVLPPNRIVLFLEGGYHLPAIAESVAASLRGLAGGWTAQPRRFTSPPASFAALDHLVRLVSRYWDLG
jgi:acetoin utilization deacetylase AcuC-like enzyme